jgi:hypothetical protein
MMVRGQQTSPNTPVWNLVGRRLRCSMLKFLSLFGVVGADECATASSLRAVFNQAFRHSLLGDAQGQWLLLDDVRIGEQLELSTCDEGVGDAELHVLQGSCEDPVELLRGKLRCASGQRRLLFDVAQPGPLYLWVRSVAATAVVAEYSGHATFDLQPPSLFEEVWLAPPHLRHISA